MVRRNEEDPVVVRPGSLQAAHRRTVDSGVDLDAARDCHLYRIYVWDHDAYQRGQRVRRLGYIGESSRVPLTRLLEHLEDQPWGDLYCGHVVDETVYGCKRDVLAAEQAAVEAERPLYNIEFNLGSPLQVPKWTAVEQRHERDRRAGRRLWQPPRERRGNSRGWGRSAPRARMASRPAAVPAAAAPSRPVRRSPRRERVVFRFWVWLALSANIWIVAALFVPLPAHATAGPSALVVGAAMTATAPGWRANSRGWRLKWCLFWAVVLAAAAAALLAWSVRP